MGKRQIRPIVQIKYIAGRCDYTCKFLGSEIHGFGGVDDGYFCKLFDTGLFDLDAFTGRIEMSLCKRCATSTFEYLGADLIHALSKSHVFRCDECISMTDKKGKQV